MTHTYRLYYNKDGTPRCYSMEELPGDYIVVTQDAYQCGRYDIRVVNGRIRSLSEDSVHTFVIADEVTDTTVMVDPQDITLIVDKNQPHILLDYKPAH